MLDAVVYVNLEDFNKNQDTTSGLWLSQLEKMMTDDGSNPDCAVRLLRNTLTGITTADSIATRMVANHLIQCCL